MGSNAVPHLVRALGSGPSAAARAEQPAELAQLRGVLLRDSLYTKSLGRDSAAFVAVYLRRADLNYRLRAAIGLSAVGGKQARAALSAAASDTTYPPSARRELRRLAAAAR